MYPDFSSIKLSNFFYKNALFIPIYSTVQCWAGIFLCWSHLLEDTLKTEKFDWTRTFLFRCDNCGCFNCCPQWTKQSNGGSLGLKGPPVLPDITNGPNGSKGRNVEALRISRLCSSSSRCFFWQYHRNFPCKINVLSKS